MRAERLRHLVAAALVGWSLAGTAATPLLESPQSLFKDLFAAVQTAHIYPDGKTFPDAVPKTAPAEILARYHAERPASAEALKAFVEAYFTLPIAVTAPHAAASIVPIDRHIDQLWPLLTRSTPSVPPYGSLLPLPEPYVVPGGRFGEVYYWDTFFTMLGLIESGRSDLVDNMVRDFAHCIDTYGHVPNGARTYYLSRSQPPFFFAMVSLASHGDPAAGFARYLAQLKGEYAFWMEGESGLAAGSAHRRVVALPGGSILNRFWDDSDTPRDESYAEDVKIARASTRPARTVYRDLRAAAESGWDFGSRWFADPNDLSTIETTEIVPIDLNSLMYGLENAIRAGCERASDAACVRDFTHRAAARRAAIDRYLWNPAQRAYFDYHWTRRAAITRVSAATLYPLFVAVASDTQATAVSGTVREQLLKPGGVVTSPFDTGQQWDAPNGWAPLQWIAVDGLRRYHQDGLAETIACRWMRTVNVVYEDSGKLVEKYDVIRTDRKGGGGEYPNQDGFGWTNGVMRKLEALYPAEAAYRQVSQCAGMNIR
ncbi:MAG: alpha,alpha-trehalase [Gammaproteobacteria bacterium]|nr:alpha,alpha-trehalase [Gammaproteobacteria bacterium]